MSWFIDLFHFNKIVFSAILLFLIARAIRAKSEPGWLKVCNPEQYSSYRNYEVGAENCPNGVWLPKASSLGCICVNGLWVLTNDWCDENYQLVYGNGHCFNVENQVRKVSYLGSTENAFEPKDYIANSHAHVFHAFNGSKSLSNDVRFFDKGLTVLRINPQSDLKLQWVTQQKGVADSVCLKAYGKEKDSDEGSESVTIFTTSAPADDIEIKDKCTDDAGSSEYISKAVIALKPGKLISVRNGIIIDSSEECYTTCESRTSHERVKRGSRRHKHKKPSPTLGRAATATNSTRLHRILIDFPAKPDPGRERANGTICNLGLVNLKNKSSDNNETMQIANEETRRALKIELNKILNGGTAPKLDSSTVAGKHWLLLQHVKKVFLTVCPPEEVPPFLVNSLMRLFRYIFIHTRDGNPYGMHFEDQSQDTRIKDALVQCADGAKPFNFYYETIKYKNECRLDASYFFEEIDDPSKPGTKIQQQKWNNVTLCKCVQELGIVNFTYPILYRNNTGMIAADTHIVNVTGPLLILPEKQRHLILGKNFTVGKHDFIVETIWKMINFAHFYCSRQFEAIPQDHSALFDKLESFFNTDIIYRWTHPGSKSAALWKAFYNTYNLEKFVNSMDACIAGAKEMSDYPKWLTRPTKQTRTKREAENPVLWDGNGFCMRDQWEPLDHLALDVPNECREGRTVFR